MRPAANGSFGFSFLSLPLSRFNKGAARIFAFEIHVRKHFLLALFYAYANIVYRDLSVILL